MTSKTKPTIDQGTIDAITEYRDVAELEGLLAALVAHRFAAILRDLDTAIRMPEEQIRNMVDHVLQEQYRDDNPLSMRYART